MRRARAWGMIALVLAAGACVPRKNKPPPLRLVALGPSRGCALQVAGPTVCWGKENGAGELGDGTREPHLFQAKVSGDLGKVTAFALGGHHTCALGEGGVMHCWGANAAGQLGRAASAEPSLVPARVAGSWDLVVAGEAHTCARGPAGVRCWGTGRGITNEGEPAVTKGARVTAMAASGERTCFALDRGDPAKAEVRCAGEERAELVGLAVRRLAMSGDAVCAVLAGGEVHCWSASGKGIAGPTPARVDLPEAAEEVGVGRAHACVRTKSGTVACWGDNSLHQLADGTATPSARPKLVYGLIGGKQLAVSTDGACALLESGEARCWGGNASGELGDGTTTEHDVPMPIKAPPH